MGYLPGFSADIFISYSHIDNYPFGEKEIRWVEYFHHKIGIRVGECLGRPITIWRDRKLGGADIFSDEIAAALGRSAVLVSVVSPGYIESKWCRRELQLFTEATRQTGGIRIGNKARIVKVLKTSVPRERLPELLDALLGYEFYRVEPDTEVAREFLIDPTAEGPRAYFAKLRRRRTGTEAAVRLDAGGARLAAKQRGRHLYC
jgi:TIR domain